MRRKLLLGRVLGLCMTMAVLIGLTVCVVEAQTGVPRVDTKEKITLTWAIPGGPEEAAVYRKLAENFMKANPNVTVRVDVEASKYTKTLTLIAAGSAPDILFFSLYNWPPVAGKGILEPLDAYIEQDHYDVDDFYPYIVKPYRYDGHKFGEGKLYGLPKEIAIRTFYYNVDAWKEAGLTLPDLEKRLTWDEFLVALKALTKREGRRVTRYGLVSDDWWGIWAIWAWMNGGEMVDDPWNPTKATLDDPKVIEGLEFFASLTTKHGVLAPLAVAAEQGKANMFAGGRAAVYYSGRWQVPLFRQSGGLNFEVMPTPAGPAGPAQLLTGSMFGISAASKHKEAAWKLLSYIVGKEGQMEMTKLGLLLPSRKSVAESDIFLKSTPPYNNRVFLDDVKYGRILPLHPRYMEMEKAVGDEFKLALNGEKSVAEAMKAANEKVNQFLQGK